ncbi:MULTISPECIES: hypothetical protein [unclassified Legionella]|uniref:hypothetical protein n=1 Tax=Legionella sp. PC997 TaxID=2755562 RepID=UPI0015FB64AC|nr:hypothetical protein [Legionella sp. PC997]QMT58902.1 hypothetical protein HBNCFIEN_00257 [Legionella sp. PC997]
MNRGGFSWKRLIGISALKAKISRKIGIPLTQSGRERKLGAFIIQYLRSFLLEKKKKR